MQVLKLAAGRLDDAGIPYQLVGSLALNYYSTPRMTRDIDIVIDVQPEDAARFTRLFEDDCYVDERTVEAEIQRRGMFNVIYNPYVLKIDFIVREETAFHTSAFSRKRQVSIEGQPVWLISPEDLVVSKLLWAKDSRSETQLGDVRSVIASVEELDTEYIDRWVSQLGLADVYNEATQ